MKKITLWLCLVLSSFCLFASAQDQKLSPQKTRELWVKWLVKISDPVLSNIAQGTLRKNMPCEADPSMKDRMQVTHLEAFGRTICGVAPWLELGPGKTPEGKLREKYIKLAQKGIKNAVDPQSPDFLNFNKGAQPLVDTAHFAQGLCRARTQLWENLDETTKAQVIDALKSSRKIKPLESNWLLFATMIEAALLDFTGECDKERLMRGVDRFMNDWYMGDGHYGDGPEFHMDYYNSFVIHPMLLDSLEIMKKHDMPEASCLAEETRRFTRYARQLELMISPEGTYPAIGRSLAYRFGAFQVLSQAALLDILPKEITPAQVRSALTKVISRQLKSPENFDKNGWLRLGFAGSQKSIANYYTSTGSLYLCTVVFLPLGLPETHEFWTAPSQKWTTWKLWDGEDVKSDYPLPAAKKK